MLESAALGKGRLERQDRGRAPKRRGGRYISRTRRGGSRPHLDSRMESTSSGLHYRNRQDPGHHRVCAEQVHIEILYDVTRATCPVLRIDRWDTPQFGSSAPVASPLQASYQRSTTRKARNIRLGEKNDERWSFLCPFGNTHSKCVSQGPEQTGHLL